MCLQATVLFFLNMPYENGLGITVDLLTARKDHIAKAKKKLMEKRHAADTTTEAESSIFAFFKPSNVESSQTVPETNTSIF